MLYVALAFLIAHVILHGKNPVQRLQSTAYLKIKVISRWKYLLFHDISTIHLQDFAKTSLITNWDFSIIMQVTEWQMINAYDIGWGQISKTWLNVQLFEV